MCDLIKKMYMFNKTRTRANIYYTKCEHLITLQLPNAHANDSVAAVHTQLFTKSDPE